jgi:hypothetical protein
VSFNTTEVILGFWALISSFFLALSLALFLYCIGIIFLALFFWIKEGFKGTTLERIED